MAADKMTNYSPEQTDELVQAYVAAPTQETVDAFAAKFGKSVRSIVAKLSREGVYQAKGKTAGKRTVTKAEMVAQLAMLCEVTEDRFESLEKATGPALMVLIHALQSR